MKSNELLLKTVFCCMACDGSIADEELSFLNTFVNDSKYFIGLDVENLINQYVAEINAAGHHFLENYLDEISASGLNTDDEMKLAEIAIAMIEADNNIEYSEISFFKDIRKRLAFSDAQFLEAFPDKEDYILPDIVPHVNTKITFNLSNISLN